MTQALTLSFEPRNDRQRQVAAAWKAAKLIICTGPAGCGKTSIALASALRDVFSGEARKMYLCRPMVAVEEELGFLPGTLDEKIGPWLNAFRDVMGNMTNVKLGTIAKKYEAVAIGMLRGRTIQEGTLLVDEAQNCTMSQLICAATRVGKGGRVVLCGDPDQSDLTAWPNPLVTFAEMIRGVGGVEWVQFRSEDQVREGFVTDVLNAIAKKR